MINTKDKLDAKQEISVSCPYLDEDCNDVVDHFACWVGEEFDDKFPGSCPFIMKDI